jgi:hypothetical protein
MDPELPGMSCAEMVSALKKIAPAVPVILVHLPQYEECKEADYRIESFDPKLLLALLQKLRPKEAIAIEQRNESLSTQERSSFK